MVDLRPPPATPPITPGPASYSAPEPTVRAVGDLDYVNGAPDGAVRPPRRSRIRHRKADDEGPAPVDALLGPDPEPPGREVEAAAPVAEIEIDVEVPGPVEAVEVTEPTTWAPPGPGAEASSSTTRTAAAVAAVVGVLVLAWLVVRRRRRRRGGGAEE